MPELSIFPGRPLSLVLRIVKAVAIAFSVNHPERRIDKVRGNNSCVILLSESSRDASTTAEQKPCSELRQSIGRRAWRHPPITSLTRVLVILEQFAGIAYIAVVVSRLIGLTIVHRDRSDLP